MKIYVLSASDGWESMTCGYYTTEEIAQAWKKDWEKEDCLAYDSYFISESELIDAMPPTSKKSKCYWKCIGLTADGYSKQWESGCGRICGAFDPEEELIDFCPYCGNRFHTVLDK